MKLYNQGFPFLYNTFYQGPPKILPGGPPALATPLSLCSIRSAHYPSENIKNDQIGLDLQGDECLVVRRLHDTEAVEKMPE